MSYLTVRKQLDAQKDDEPPPVDHRCAANGCPNAGSIIDHPGEKGRCYWHWKAPPETWPAVTERIKANFEKMRNF